MIAHLKDIYRNRDGEWVISFSTPEDFTEEFDRLSEMDVRVEIKKASKHRSLSANNLAWELIDKIAERTGVGKTEVYRNAIREIGGVSTYAGLRDDVIPAFRQSWESGHTGRQVEVIEGSTKTGWSNVRIYFGSSEFDTAQMSRLIDSLKQDAEALGIPTVSPKEEERLLAQWGRKREGNDRNERGNDHSTESR